MSDRTTIALSLSLFIITLPAVFSGCIDSSHRAKVSSTPEEGQTASTPVSAPPEQQPESKQGADRSMAITAACREVIARAYQGAVTVDESRGRTSVTGDFNGDDSEDIAVIVRPARGMLPRINNAYANWTLEDTKTAWVIDVHKNAQQFPKKPPPVMIRQDDMLLAVIHGYQKDGWRNPQATQVYLLKNAVGQGLMREAPSEIINATENKEKLPVLKGDVIQEVLEGELGFLYWTGAKYAWYR